jgi:type II secretory pathway component PulF
LIWLTVVSGSAAALRLALTDAPLPTGTVELAAVGWPPARLRTATVAASVAVTGMALIAGMAVANTQTGMLTAFAAALWAPVATAPLLRGVVLASFRSQRDGALLEWLRRTRLYCAAGRPINDAAVAAAERVKTPAFAPAATTINLALAAGRDPLAAAVEHFAGSAAETLVATVAAADRGGAAATDLIDRLISQAVKALEDERRVRIEALGRAVTGTATLSAATASAVVVLALLASTSIGL